MTKEELKEEERKLNERMDKIEKARAAIVAHLGGKWRKGTPGAKGRIACPVCGTADGLAFSRAGYNGHIHAACVTPECVRWVE